MIIEERWNAAQPIRCPVCAHRFAQFYPEPPKLTVWDKIRGWFGHYPKPPVTTPVVFNAEHYRVFDLVIDQDHRLQCERCQQLAPLKQWRECGDSPIDYIDHWNSMCECGGEFWAEFTSVSTDMVMECDRCNAHKGHEITSEV